MGVVHMFRTPLVKVTLRDKTVLEFLTEREFKAWEAREGKNLKGWSSKYYKGLGTSTAAEFKSYFERMDQFLFRVERDPQRDMEAIELAFSNTKADERKKWLETPALVFEDLIV